MEETAAAARDTTCSLEGAGSGDGSRGWGARRTDAFNGPCYLKFLVHNHIAGSIIGKGGSMVHQLTEETGCKIKLSPQSNFYPGTKEERPMAVSGTLDAIMTMIEKVLDKTREQPYHAQDGRTAVPRVPEITFKIVAPNSSCSQIIGTGGGPIQELQKSTDTKIQISNREDGIQERVVSIGGSKDGVFKAAKIIAEKLQDDEHLRTHMYVVYNGQNGHCPKSQCSMGVNMGSFTFPPMPHPALNPYMPSAAPPSTAAMFGMMLPGLKNSTIVALDSLLQSPCEITMGVPEACAGAIIGCNLELGTKIAHDTGVYMQMSNKGDYFPGTTNRKLVLTGTVSRVHTCHFMIYQKICELNGTPPPCSGPIGSVGFTVAGMSPMAGNMVSSSALTQNAVQQAVAAAQFGFQPDASHYAAAAAGTGYHMTPGAYGQFAQYG